MIPMKKSRHFPALFSAITALLLAVSLGIWGATVSAAEAADAEETEATATEDTEVTASGPSSEVFIPTEEISEDFAVSFPVDI